MHTRAVAAAAVVGLALLSGCGGASEVDLPTAPPASDGASPTRTLPEVSRSPTRTPEPPSPTQTRTPDQSEEPAETPTEEPPPAQETTPDAEPTMTDTAIALPPGATDAPDRTGPAEEPTETEPNEEQPPAEETTPEQTPAATQTSSPPGSTSPSPAESALADAADSGTPWWLWLVPLVAAAGGIWWFVTARSRRRRWDESLEAVRVQARWLLDTLVPTMVNPTAAASALSVHWDSAQLTLDKLEAGLADLVAEPPDEARRATARELAESVSQLRRAVATDLALRAGTSPIPADPESLGVSAASVQVARDRLAAALPMPTPASPA